MLLLRPSSWLPFPVEVTSKCPSCFGNNTNWGLMLLYSGTLWYENGNLRYLYLNQNDREWKGKRNVPNCLRNQPCFLRCRRSWYPSNATLYASISCISYSRNKMLRLLSTWLHANWLASKLFDFAGETFGFHFDTWIWMGSWFNIHGFQRFGYFKLYILNRGFDEKYAYAQPAKQDN